MIVTILQLVEVLMEVIVNLMHNVADESIRPNQNSCEVVISIEAILALLIRNEKCSNNFPTNENFVGCDLFLRNISQCPMQSLDPKEKTGRCIPMDFLKVNGAKIDLKFGIVKARCQSRIQFYK